MEPAHVTRFNATCLIGNWAEDRDVQRACLKDLLAKKGTGTLKLDGYQQRMSVALQDVQITRVADDSYVHYGDVLQLVHVDTGAVVSVDINTQVGAPGEESCCATAAPEVRGPCARNTFLLLRYQAPKESALEQTQVIEGDNVLRYGQKVLLAANPLASGDEYNSAGGLRPLVLFSKPVSTSHSAKYSRQQLVGFTARTSSYDAVWQVVTPDVGQRTLSEGVEVYAGAPILLVHCGTSKPLCLEAYRYPTEFGVELELSTRLATTAGLKLSLEQTAKGVHKGFLPKGATSDNHFVLVPGATVARLPPPQSRDAEGDRVLAQVVEELAGLPGDAAAALERKLVTLEDRRRELPLDEFIMILRQVGSGIAADDIAALLCRFPGERPRTLHSHAFLEALRQLTGNNLLQAYRQA